MTFNQRVFVAVALAFGLAGFTGVLLSSFFGFEKPAAGMAMSFVLNLWVALIILTPEGKR